MSPIRDEDPRAKASLDLAPAMCLPRLASAVARVATAAPSIALRAWPTHEGSWSNDGALAIAAAAAGHEWPLAGPRQLLRPAC